MAKITYEDKVALNINPDIPDTNKCNASDMNEIKKVVNENANINEYLTTEQVIGKWINGKLLYRKIIDLGNLPNNTAKTVPTGLIFNSSNCILTNLYGVASYSNGISFPLPFSSTNGIDYNVALNVDNNNNVVITTSQDRSAMTGYAILEYIKATD